MVHEEECLLLLFRQQEGNKQTSYQYILYCRERSLGSGPMSFHLGCGFERDRDTTGTLCMNPRKYIDKNTNLGTDFQKNYGYWNFSLRAVVDKIHVTGSSHLSAR